MTIKVDKELARTALLGFLLVLFAVLFGGCDRIAALTGKNAAQGPVEPEIPVFAVNTVQAEEGPIADYLALAGDIVAGSTVDAYSDAAGKVSLLYTAVGRRVSRNDPIAAVDPSRPGMNYVANIVRSPIAGTVVALPAQVGMTVSQATPIARISGGGALEIKLNVAERFISRIALSLPCVITLDAWPGEEFRGSVSEISPVVDPSSRTMEIKVNVENQGSRLKAGMFAKVHVITERKQSVVRIPESARVERFGETYVYVVETDRRDPAFRVAVKRPIKSGILIDGVLEVPEGLSPAEEIVVRGQSLLEDGTRVNVIQ
ncbi:MAG: efflux RND transporter periplasmic adaptor subunit [Spirochaetaceae bacterium]|jgi:multidrug efflux pump subunit AcrA (membrane-fusion protein)|nr:efflux RND transporter periplasmic adaptor subunit [Spirochaetaceae bacterium]